MVKPVRKANRSAPPETVPCRGISTSTGAPCKNRIKLTPGAAPQPHFCHQHRNKQLNRYDTRKSAKEEALRSSPFEENSVRVLGENFKNWKIDPPSRTNKPVQNSSFGQFQPSSSKPIPKKTNLFSKAKNFFTKINSPKNSSTGLSNQERNNSLIRQNSVKQPQHFGYLSTSTQPPSYNAPPAHVFGKPSFKFSTSATAEQPQQVVICRGKKRSGKPCTIKVRLPEANDVTASSYYCRYHRDQAQSPIMLPVRLRGWIPRNVSQETLYKLQVEMAKPISDRDQPGYIYVYQTEELGSDGLSVHNYYKIGRTNNLPRRLDQWNKGCGKVVKLIESFPSAVSSSTTSPNPQCPYSHRLERLIHIHLADKYKVEPFYCGGCSRYHTEWFMVPTPNYLLGKYPGWPIIRPIIQHWLRFVNALETSPS